MPNPTPKDAHVDAALTNISVANMQTDDMFIASRAFPMVPVTKQSDKYFIHDRRDWLRNEVKKRAPGTESAGGGRRLSTDTYFAEVFAIHEDVGEQDRANADPAVDPDVDATDWVTQQMMIAREVEVQRTYFTTSLWTGSTTAADITPGTLWDVSTGTPIKDIKNQAISIAKKNGVNPNNIKLIAPPDVWVAISQNPTVQDQVKYVRGGGADANDTAILAKLLGIGEVLVPWCVQDTSKELAATEVTGFVWTQKDALLVYTNPQPGKKKFTAGYVFAWTGMLGASAFGSRISRIPMDWLGIGTVRIEGEMAFDAKVVAATGGAYFNNVIS